MKLRRVGVLGAIVLAAVALALLSSRYGTLSGLEELELLTLDRRQQTFADELRAARDGNQIVLVLFDSTAVRDWLHRVGVTTLFMHRTEVEAAWRWIEQISDGWKAHSHRPSSYNAGTWGPPKSVALLERDGRSWYEHVVESGR